MLRRRWRGIAIRTLATLVAVIGLSFGSGCRNGQRTGTGGATAPVAPSVVVRVATAARSIPFRVEVARTTAQQQRGLMYRTEMAADAGMLFVFERAAPLTFWMKNTLIPLDMIFIDSGRRIVSIVENAEPQTLDLRGSEGPAQYVLEINGGLSAKLGIRAGDKVDLADVLGS